MLYVLTPLIKSSVKFCVDEVFEDRGGIDMRRIRRGKSSRLGMPPSKYSRRLKRLSLGMPRKASHLSSTIIGMFRFLFCSHDMRKFLERRVLFLFLLIIHHAGMRQSLVDLQNDLCTSLYLLSMALQNASCASLISFEVWMPVSLHLENHYLQNALLLHLYLLGHGQVFCRNN